MPDRSIVTWLVAVAAVGLAVFVALTAAVTGNTSLAIDTHAFTVAHDLRAPWLDHAMRIVTTLGLIAIVGPAVLIGAAILIRRHGRRIRALALCVGCALTWITVWVTKGAVDRPRPPEPLVHTGGQSFPSAHAANSVGWLALAIALAVTIPTTRLRIAAITAGALVALLVGLSRVYLRAHYLSDVIAGEAVAVAMYSLTAIAAIGWKARRERGAAAH